MNIEKIQLEHVTKYGFASADADGVCHKKTEPYLSVVQAKEGSYDIQLQDGPVRNTGRSGFFIAPSDVLQTILHRNDPQTNWMHCRWIFCKIKINNLYVFDKLYDLPMIPPEPFRTQLDEIFDRLFSAESIYDEYICYHQIIKLLSMMATEKSSKPPICVETAMECIQKHYAEKITVAQLAAIAKMSESNFHAVFRKSTGFSPIKYLNNFRLSLAAEMLINTSDEAAVITEAVGIHDSVYFHRMFKKAYHMSPLTYRNIYRSPPA